MVQFIPGTALPTNVDEAGSGEGRGEPSFLPSRIPGPSLFEKLGDRDDITPSELAVITAALRVYDQRPKKERTVDNTVGARTDATTGNLVVELFSCPQGWEAHIANVTVDAPGSATITPTAPFASGSAWSFISVAPPTTGEPASLADALRVGMVTFAPVAAGGPIIPGQWTFNDSNARVAYGGESIFYCLHGGSVAALLNLTLQVGFRLNLYARSDVG